MLSHLAGALLAAAPAQAYDTVFDQLKSMAPRPERVATVRTPIVLRRDVIELRLDSGMVYLLTPVAGRTVGIAFVGAGSVSFVPPLAIEQFNLKRVLGDSAVTGPITAAVFIFTDSTEAQLARTLSFGAGLTTASSGAASSAVDEALAYLMDGRSRRVDHTLMAGLLNGTSSAYFSAYVQRTRGESVMLQFDPTEAEEVLLFRRGKMVGQRTEVVCQFQRAEDLANEVSVADELPEALTVHSYDIDVSIDGNYKFAARSTMRLIGRRDPQQWAGFYLYEELRVDSVTTAAGVPLTFYRRDREAELWVRFAQPLEPGDTVGVRVVYHGGVIAFGSAMEDFLPPWWTRGRREFGPVLDSWAFIKSPSNWYPRYSFLQRAAFTMTFHTPKVLKFATIGRLVDSSTVGNVTTTRWVSELPARNVSFNIGTFEQLDIRDPRIPPVTVLVNSEAHRHMSRVFLSARQPGEFVGADIVNSLSFFTRVFGDPLYHQYYATEIPYFHGEAFPGLIHLTWTTFLGFRTNGEDEIFRAHEMAHQWWGIGVEPAGYRDAWLSEGFSTFAGLWYMQVILRDNDKYLRALREYRQDIRREREKTTPIGLGRRAGQSWTGNYALTTYQKGAWVLQMLRNMMLDSRTMSEERFTAMMRDFYTTYRGKRASTLDFQRTVERHIGQPMDWFFHEWVYGTAVPTYTFSWTAERDSIGHIGRVRVRQSDVPDGFVMYVPILVKFDEGEALIRVLVRGSTTDGSIRLPMEPKTMQLNPLESVLAEVKTEAWRP